MTKKHQPQPQHPPASAEAPPEQKPDELNVCRQKCDEYLNNWKRAEADFMNYRKGEQERIAGMLQFGNERILLEVIDFLDALYEAFRHAPESTDKTWLDGMRQVAKKCTDMLARHKVIEIAAVGQVFDPLRHEAVGMIPNRGEAGKVLEVMRAGYEMHNKVIRPTRVMVSS